MRKKNETHLHFVGIGGIGMSGIAEVFLNQGYVVSGSDLAESDNTRKLAKQGAKIAIGHETKNVQGAHVVIISSAVRPTNPEVLEARRLRIPIIPRAEMLGELMRGKVGISVAGTHGKTTTTSMLATVLSEAGLDPTIVIGGKVDSLGGNAKLGQGSLVVAEADESDGSFLHLPATFAIITNIDNDHLDHFGSLNAVEDAFVEFVDALPFYGYAVVCGEDSGVKRCLTRFTKPFVTYGLFQEGEAEQWDYCARDVEYHRSGSSFTLVRRVADSNGRVNFEDLGRFQLNVPGKHNVLNGLATVVMGLFQDVPPSRLAHGLKTFKGVRRRFDIRYESPDRKICIVDDYGHHPTEILATLSAARGYWPGRIIAVFQPHRYSRTLSCNEGFKVAFQNADVLYISDIYSAGEEPIDGVSSETLARDIRTAEGTRPTVVEYLGDLESVKAKVLASLQEGDLVIFMGAGSITRLPDGIVKEL